MEDCYQLLFMANLPKKSRRGTPRGNWSYLYDWRQTNIPFIQSHHYLLLYIHPDNSLTPLSGEAGPQVPGTDPKIRPPDPSSPVGSAGTHSPFLTDPRGPSPPSAHRRHGLRPTQVRSDREVTLSLGTGSRSVPGRRGAEGSGLSPASPPNAFGTAPSSYLLPPREVPSQKTGTPRLPLPSRSSNPPRRGDSLRPRPGGARLHLHGLKLLKVPRGSLGSDLGSHRPPCRRVPGEERRRGAAGEAADSPPQPPTRRLASAPRCRRLYRQRRHRAEHGGLRRLAPAANKNTSYTTCQPIASSDSPGANPQKDPAQPRPIIGREPLPGE